MEQKIPFAYKPIRQRTVVGQVMEQLKELIASGNLKPGDQIPTEQELAKHFGVGRSSIREAIKVFTYLGIFESQTRNGTILCGNSRISAEALTWSFILSHDDFKNLMEVRKAIELEAWLTLCEKVKTNQENSQTVIEALQHEVDHMEKSLLAKDNSELVEADFRFHQTVVTSSGNSLFLNLFDTLKSFTCEEITRSNMQRNYSPQIVFEHAEMIKALEKADSLSITHLFRTHISNAINRVLSSNHSTVGMEKYAEENSNRYFSGSGNHAGIIADGAGPL